MSGKHVGSNSSSLLTSEGLFCSMGVNPHCHLLLRARETQLLAPSCVLEYQCGELVAFGFAQERERKPELMCIAAGLQLGDELVDLGDELVDLGCLPIAV